MPASGGMSTLRSHLPIMVGSGVREGESGVCVWRG